ncbi:phage antirepressor KilAC domain-containing protein [Acinetobacter lactucae]|uniref:Phage antirepressor KilAC domain-containing protein n=1 Tax=Acinetobacter lactucae TaxID=1785128 RepID=A0AB35K2Q5_9GAMM|nr:phage antirepressor KilAC domain-containing protein [Acinetobacter lactucae]MDD9321982.1 phage antirepressor KilAC domain-containing protein [Acinetobacter lactucae]
MQPIQVIYYQADGLLSIKGNALGQPNLNDPISSKGDRVVVDISNPHALRRALLDYTEQVIHLKTQNQCLERTIDTITQTPAGVKFQQACKILNIKRQILASWLREHGWDRHLNNVRTSTYYSQSRGYCETKYEKVVRVSPNGDHYTFTMVEFFILPKGMKILVKAFGKDT